MPNSLHLMKFHWATEFLHHRGLCLHRNERRALGSKVKLSYFLSLEKKAYPVFQVGVFFCEKLTSVYS